MRSPGGVARQAGNAAWAALTAALTSAAEPAGDWPRGSPVAGLVRSRPGWLADACQAPPTKLRIAGEARVAMGLSLYRFRGACGIRFFCIITRYGVQKRRLCC